MKPPHSLIKGRNKPCPAIARRERGLVCGAPNGICNQRHNEGLECPFKPGGW